MKYLREKVANNKQSEDREKLSYAALFYGHTSFRKLCKSLCLVAFQYGLLLMTFTYMIKNYFTGNGASAWLLYFQWRNSKEYG